MDSRMFDVWDIIYGYYTEYWGALNLNEQNWVNPSSTGQMKALDQ
jgi:hypothetical protein